MIDKIYPKCILVYFILTDEDVKWSTKKASDQQIANLNDEIENLKTEKKKMRALVDSRDADIGKRNF